MKKNILTFLVLFASFAAFAQKDSTDKSDEKRSYGQLAIEFASNNVYNGRKDSLVTPYFTPSVGYYAKSGFYLKGSLSYLMRSGSGRIDESSLTAGYEFSIGNFDGEIYAEKPFYNGNSTNVKAEQTGSLAASAAYNFGFIAASVEPTVSFSANTDIALSAKMDHEFDMSDGAFDITPSVIFNGSTLNFYQSYFDKRRFKNLKNSNTKVNAKVKNASAFSLLDYEFSLPVEYTSGKFTFSCTPYYTVPLNPAEVTVTITPNVGPPATDTFTEKLSNTFYVKLEVDWKF